MSRGERMKLAEALVRRSDLRKRVEQLRERIKLSALIQDGEEPPENPTDLMAELERVLVQMTTLVKQVNRPNLSATLPDGKTLTDALAERDALTLHYSVLESIASAATPKVDRMGRAEIRKIPTIKVSTLRREMDDLAQRRRELDVVIQSVNWNVEVLE